MIATEAGPPHTVFMIVAHNQPAMLARLVGRLVAPWSKILVAIDLKADQRPFETALAGLPVTFLAPDMRVDVRWGGIGLTTAAIRMIRESIVRWSAQRFCMLSGVDYPTKPVERIGLALKSTTEWVRVDRRLDAAGTGLHDDFIRFPHFNDVRLLNPRSSALPKLQRAVTRGLRNVSRKQMPGLDLFHGCGWWAITRQAAEWLLEFFERRPDIFAWLRHVNCPDEIFVQSLLKASPAAGRIAQDLTIRVPQAAERNLHGCHYIDWGDGDSSSPKNLDLSDLPALQASPALFARKFDPVRSLALLDALDDEALPALREEPRRTTG